jgi:hypothetical protein
MYIGVRSSPKTRSGEKMQIPPRRIVGLVVIGLIVGALAKLIQRAVLLRGGALATFEVGDERFRTWTTNPQTIQDLHKLQQGTSTASIPNGRILYGSGRAKHNAPYHWHLDPQDISMVEVAIELCDASLTYVEENVDEFVGTVGRYCPWQARLVELRDYRGRAGRQTSSSGQ